MKKDFQKEQGFTLIETIIYIGLLALIIIFLAAFFQQSILIKAKINERLENLDNAQYAMDRISWYLQNSIKVKEPLSGQSSNQLVIDTLVTEKNPVEFFVEEGQLKMRLIDEPALSLTNKRLEVKELKFINQGFVNQPAIIKIILTIASRQTLWQIQPLTLETSVKLGK